MFFSALFLTIAVHTHADGLLWPIERPQRITGTFCEPRDFRFHMGLDVSCAGRKGFPIRAADDGFVSTVMYQKWGIGYAVFVTHADKTRTLYGHLDGFAPLILENTAVKDNAENILNRRDFRVELADKVLPVRKGSIIGFSGDSGIGREHFHFELRDENNANLNPLTHGMKVADRQAPVFTGLYLFPMDCRGVVNGSPGETYLKIVPVKGRPGFYTPGTGMKPVVSGKVGIKVKVHDYTGYTRRVAVYRIEARLNGGKIYSARFDRMPRAEITRMGLYYDLERTSSASYTHNLFLRDTGEGIIDTDVMGNSFTVTVIAGDAAGNTSTLTLNLNKGAPLSAPSCDYMPNLKPGRTLTLKSSDRKCTLFFEKTSAYYDEMIGLSEFPGIGIAVPGLSVKSRLYIAAPGHLCIRTPAEVSLDYRGEDRDRVGLYLFNPRNNLFYFVSNSYDVFRKCFTAKTHRMGGYFLVRDDAAPTIRFRPPKRPRAGYRFRFMVSDTGSGINLEKTELTVDEKTVHWDYDPDYGYIEILPHSDIWRKGSHQIRLQIEDLAGNKSRTVTHTYTI